MVIRECPSCSGPLETRELHCPTCDLTLRGRFAAPVGADGDVAVRRMLVLSDEQVAFLRLFVGSRGNLSDVERTLGISYPTVRAKLDDLAAALDERLAVMAAEAQRAPEKTLEGAPEAAGAEDPPATRHEVLSRIAAGHLSAKVGVALIKRLADKR